MIFLCYRASDTSVPVRLLYERLTERYGTDNVFMDRRGISPGDRWRSALRQEILGRKAVVVVIGKKWNAPIPVGPERTWIRPLERLEDWVRQEICCAIQNKKRIIQVLIDGATFPDGRWYCELDELSEFQRMPLSTKRHFGRDVANLCGTLEKWVRELRIAARRRDVRPRTAMRPSLLKATDLEDRRARIDFLTKATEVGTFSSAITLINESLSAGEDRSRIARWVKALNWKALLRDIGDGIVDAPAQDEIVETVLRWRADLSNKTIFLLQSGIADALTSGQSRNGIAAALRLLRAICLRDPAFGHALAIPDTLLTERASDSHLARLCQFS